jgi:protein kinase-like protein
MNDQDLMPTRLGEYRLLDRIGEGGMGVVFLARDRKHRTVALKVLRATVANDPTARRRLAREVETMQRVRNPNVAEVIDADLEGDMPYIVTRFVPGRTLDDVVTQDGPLRGAALARLASGLAEALVAVHAAGVVHRDVKPGNVMMFQGNPVVIDFGIAQGPDATRLTMTGMFMGTPGYLAPEVIEGRPSSEASDVHAWGATVAFAATGRPPYGTGPYEGIFYRIVNGQADLSGIPGPLLPLLAAALARDPAHRPPAVQLRAQAAVINPATLVPDHGQTGPAVPLTATDAAATRSAGGPAPGAPVAYLPPAATASPAAGPAGYVPPTVTGAPGGAAANGAGPPPASPSAPGTRPMAQQRPLPGDLSDVLTPVSYTRRPAAPAAAGPAGGPAPAAPARGPAVPARSPATPEPAARARWSPVLVAASVVVLASVSVILPVAGTVAALSLFAVLRTAGLVQRRTTARRAARGARATDPVVAVVSLPWFFLRSFFALLLLAPFALAAAALAAGVTVAVAPADWPYRALAYAAGALVLFYGLGPGSGVPRSQLRRFYGAFARNPASRIVVVLGVTALALGALTAAMSSPSVYWPTVVPGNVLHFGVTHLWPFRSLAYLAHLSGPHRFGLLHHRFLPRGLLRHLG